MSSSREPIYSPTSERAYERLPQILREMDEDQPYPIEIKEREELTNLVLNPSMESMVAGEVIGKNLYPNPSFEAPGGALRTFATNVVTNPNGRNRSGTVVIRTNLSHSSNFVQGSDSTLGSGTVYAGDTWHRLSQNSAVSASALLKVEISDLLDDRPYTTSVEVVNDGTSTLTVRLGWCDSPMESIQLHPGVRGRIAVTGARSEYSESNRHAILSISGDRRYILFRNPLIEHTDTALAYFDGSTAPASTDVSHRWVGTTNASKSEVVAPSMVGWTADNGAVYWSESRQRAVLVPMFRGKVTAHAPGSSDEVGPVMTTVINTTDRQEWSANFDGAYPQPDPSIPIQSDVTAVQYTVLGGAELPVSAELGTYWVNSNGSVYRKVSG